MDIELKDRSDNRPVARSPNEADVRPPPQAQHIVDGTVGWEGVDEHYELGSAENDGFLLVRVQIFGGKPPWVASKPGIAQGHQILCRVGLMPFRVPPKGTYVVVALPYGDIQTTGRGVILATVEKNPTTQFDAKRVVYDVGPDTEVIFRGKCVTLQSYASPVPQYISVGTPRAPGATPGVRIYDETGSGLVLSSGKLMIAVTDNGSPTPKVTKFLSMSDADGIDVMNTDGGSIKSSLFVKNNGDVWIGGANARIFTRGVYLAASATALTPVLIGNPASPTPSTVVFGSPT